MGGALTIGDAETGPVTGAGVGAGVWTGVGAGAAAGTLSDGAAGFAAWPALEPLGSSGCT